MAVFSGVGARDVREKQVSRVSLRGRSGGGEVKGRGIVWHFKMKEGEVWQFCLYGTPVPNIRVLKINRVERLREWRRLIR